MPHYDELLSLLVQNAPIQAVVVGASPATIIADADGKVVVQGGTVTLIELGRKSSFVSVGVTVGVVPVARGDQIRITYTLVPTVTYFKG